MRKHAVGSAAPVRACRHHIQRQKRRDAARGWAWPAGRRGRRENTAQSAPESLQIAARTEKPLDLVTTATSAPRQLSVEHLGGAWQAAAWRGTGSAPDGAARTKAPYLRLAPLNPRVAGSAYIPGHRTPIQQLWRPTKSSLGRRFSRTASQSASHPVAQNRC